MTKFILFGPPGIGKSTTISELAAIGVDACDLEEISSDRLEYFLHSDHLIYGGADLNPRFFKTDPDVVTILLTLPTERAYQLRRAHRDLRSPEKRDQPIQKRWKPGTCHYTVMATEWAIHEILDLMSMWSHEPVLLTERGQTSR